MQDNGLWKSVLRTLAGIRRQSNPRMISNFAVTYRCNGRCRTCKIWKLESPEPEELTLGDIQSFLEENKDFLKGIESIQITRGEQFLMRDFPEIASSMREYLPRSTLWIPTNGMDPEGIVEAVEAMLTNIGGQGLGISVSVDGLEGTHDGIRGVDGSFRRSSETLSRLAALRVEHPRLALAVGMTVTPENPAEVGEVYSLALQLGVEFSLRPVNISDIYYRNAGEEPLGPDSLPILVPVLRRIGRDTVERRGFWKSAPTLRYLQGLIEYVRDPRRRIQRCSAASESFFLDPYGDIYPCIFMDTPLGNVRETSLADIWGSPEAGEARQRVRGFQRPNCWVECESFRGIHGDPKELFISAFRALQRPFTLGLH